MRFWIVQAQENPAESRTVPRRREWRSNTLAEVLADRGHEVVRWRSSFSHQAKEFLVQGSPKVAVDNYSHQFIDCPPYRSHVGLARIRNHQSLGRNFGAIANSYQNLPDLIHVGNVPIELCYAAVRFGRVAGIPVVIDVRDLWPDTYVDFIPWQLSFLRQPLLKLLYLISPRLRWAFSQATAIIGLTQSYLDWGLEIAKLEQRSQDAVFPFCYPQRNETWNDVELAALRQKIGINTNDIVACYIGNIGYQSDFKTVIAAAQKLSDRYPNFKVIIAGSGPQKDSLVEVSKELPNVIFPGWLSGSEVVGLTHLSSFGLIAYESVPNFLRNLPNKYAEYLAGGLAIACGLEGEMAYLTRNSNCGFVYRSKDADMLSNEIAKLIDRPEDLAKIKSNAKTLHETHFNSASVYPVFADYLESLAKDSIHNTSTDS